MKGSDTMADVKWIKIMTDVFDNKKIKQIECLPDGDGIIVIWVKLLCLAGNTNDNGMVYLTKDIPYTEQMLAAQFNRPLTLVQIALNTFRRFGMIDVVDDILYVSNWEKYQSVDRLREIREYNRLAQQKSREKKKLLQNVNDKSMTSQRCHDTDIDIDIELEKEKDKEIDKNNIKYEFETLWKMYPNKKGKDKALGYYQKARKSGTTFEDVEQGIKNYCKEIEIKKTSKQYIQHGSTWFNNKGWLDDYDFTFNPIPNQKQSKYSYVPDDTSDLPF